MIPFNTGEARRFVHTEGPVRPAILEGLVLGACDEIDRLRVAREVRAENDDADDAREWEEMLAEARDEIDRLRAEVELVRERVSIASGYLGDWIESA